MKNVSVKVRLNVCFGAMLAALICLAVITQFGLNDVSKQTSNLYTHPYTVSTAVLRIDNAIVNIQVSLNKLLLAETDEQKKAAIAAINRFDASARDDFRIVRKYFLGDKSRIDELNRLFVSSKPARDKIINAAVSGDIAPLASAMGPDNLPNLPALDVGIQGLIDFASNKADQFLASAEKNSSNIQYIILASITLIVLLSVPMMLWVTRSIVKPVNQAVEAANSIAAGNTDTEIVVESNDETGRLLNALADMQKQLRERAEEKERIMHEENSRMSQTLDQLSSCVIVADQQGQFTYCNSAARKLLAAKESQLKQTIPGFRAAHPEALNIEQFDSTSKSRGNDSQSSETTLLSGNATFQILLQAVTVDGGKLLGYVMQITDQTDQLLVETEVQSVVEGVLSGELHNRIDLDNKTGFIATLSERVNTLVELNETVVESTVTALSEMANGNLNHQMTGKFQGVFGTLKDNVNSTQAQLKKIIEQVQCSARNLGKSAEKLIAVNVELSESANTSAERANSASRNTSQVSENISSVASAALQMTSSIKGIAANTVEAASVADRAIELTAGTEVTVRQLNASSNNIGSISNVITSIAEQTNLLALNATIEAARAGESGKGFAVVANEVKELAKETAQATEQIKKSIESIQSDSRNAENAINIISSTINQIGELQSTTSTAVLEQESVASEISRSVTDASDKSSDITREVTDVANCANETQATLAEVKQLATDLFRSSEQLEASVSQFN